VGAGFAYASFGRRVAALAIDAALIAAALVMIVAGTNAIAGPVLAAFWTTPVPVATQVEVASRTSEAQEGGGRREAAVSRESRAFADGTVRIYLVVEGRQVAADGAITTTHVEELIGRNLRDLQRAWFTAALAVALSLFYFVGFEASSAQATPGKAVLGLKVADLNGRRIGPARALFRQLVKGLEIASSGITYVIAAFTGRRQALHDMFAGTLVLQTDQRPFAGLRRAAAF
jgi:uncharacterized RDD family membrane protein YckC